MVDKTKKIKTRIHNFKILKSLRKGLRNNITPAEIILWSRLKKPRSGYKFSRQQSVGKYIVDFYCPEKKLIIEIDGSGHAQDLSENMINRERNILKRIIYKH